jgi:predicted peptidase
MKRIIALTVMLLTAWGCIAQPAAPAQTNMQTAQKFIFKASQEATVDYLLFLPAGYQADTAKRWPLILFLHGAGERGSDVRKVAVHGPVKYIAKHPDFPFIMVSPQCPEGKHWSNDQLLGLLEEIKAHYRVDASRVYLTGLSMGGYGSWSLGTSYPEKFAAIVPICGGGEMITVLLADKTALKSLGVWAFHGGKDPVVPLSESERMVEALKKAGVPDVKLTVYPEAGHDSWTEAYSNPELYWWLLNHRRADAK